MNAHWFFPRPALAALWVNRFVRLRIVVLPFVLSVLVVLGGSGCQTLPPFSPLDLQEPGWRVREGQAVWKRQRRAPEVAGEIIVATRPNGQAFVQFSKNPFPLLIAQTAADAWEVQLPTENKRYSGRGQPPARLLAL